MLTPPIRPWRLADAASLVAHANNIKVASQLRDRFPSPYRLSDAEAWLAQATSTNPPVAFAIEVDGQAVGGVGLEIGTDVHRLSAEVGYWLGEAHWGKGLATAALVAVTAHAFHDLGLIRVFAFPFADNEASLRVLEKAGYKREGRLAQAAVKNGRARDMCLYAITREYELK